MRILMVEDDTALAGFVRKGLEAEHYAVDVSSDGEQARALAAEFDYDLVILDLNLPKLDGVTILKDHRNGRQSGPSPFLSPIQPEAMSLALGGLVVRRPFHVHSARITLSDVGPHPLLRSAAAIPADPMVRRGGRPKLKCRATPARPGNSDLGLLEARL